jgi:hypothetical protein
MAEQSKMATKTGFSSHIEFGAHFEFFGLATFFKTFFQTFFQILFHVIKKVGLKIMKMDDLNFYLCFLKSRNTLKLPVTLFRIF